MLKMFYKQLFLYLTHLFRDSSLLIHRIQQISKVWAQLRLVKTFLLRQICQKFGKHRNIIAFLIVSNQIQQWQHYKEQVNYFKKYKSWNRIDRILLLKLMYSEKATKFCKISTLLLTGTTTQDKSEMKIQQNFVAFSEYMNLKSELAGIAS